MSESSYYCPLSGRFSDSELTLFNAVDAPIERLAERTRSAEDVADEVDERLGAYIDSASDALFDAFESARGALLVSRIAFEADDLVEICAELSAAAGRRELTGVLRSSLSKDGHLVVALSHIPTPGPVSEASEVQQLFADLEALHSAGLVHGGLNERFINPGATAGPRISGVGLSHAYAAWRRYQGFELAGLRADPRFAAPELIEATFRDEVDDELLKRSDRFALATVILTEIQEPGAPGPAMDAVNGANALMHRAGKRGVWLELAQNVGDKKSGDLLRNAIEAASTAPDQRLWYYVAIAALALILLMQLWMVTRPDSSPEPTEGNTSGQSLSTSGAERSMDWCRGEGLRVVDDRCILAEGFAECGRGTRLDTETGQCVVADSRGESVADADRVADAGGQVEDYGSTYIHPVLTCDENANRRGESFAFTDDDINFTQGEKYTLQRLTNGCNGPASIIYYMSDPSLEDRAQTIFNEFRSSSSCDDGCRSVMPESPTAVVYIPYIGMLERSNRHYMFFHCCVND